MHPAAGYIFLGVIIVSFVWVCVYLGVTIYSRPKVLNPPKIEDRQTATVRHLHRYIRYLIKYLSRLINNELVSEENVGLASKGIAELNSVVEKFDRNELVNTVTETEKNIIEPILAEIDEHAKKAGQGVDA